MEITMEEVMASIFFWLVQGLVIAAVIVMLFFLYRVILEKHNAVERLLRAAAFGSGLLMYVGAGALGLSIPELMVSALVVASPLGLSFLGVVFPALAGTVVAWFCLRLMQKDDDVAARGMLLFSAFFFTMFADTYANIAPQAASTDVDLVLPNITFVLGVVLYAIFKYKPKPAEQGHRSQSVPEVGRGLRGSVRKFRERLGFRSSSDDAEALEENHQESEEQPDTKAAQEDSQNRTWT